MNNPIEIESGIEIIVDPEKDQFDTPGFAANREKLRQQDVVLFDAASRPEFGRVGQRFREDGPITTEVNNRTVRVVGLIEVGPSFGIDGTVMTSIDNWLRLFPERPRDEIQLGLIRLKPGADPVEVADAAFHCASTDLRLPVTGRQCL